MFNPRDDRSVRQLGSLLKDSVQEMAQARQNRLRAQRELLGKHSPYKGTGGRRHLNFHDMAVTIYKQALVPYHPRCAMTARKRDFAPYAFSYELAINAILGEDYVSDEMETLAMESLISPMGVLKIMLDAEDVATVPDAMGGVVQVTTGTPKVKAITFDNWVQDMSASSPSRVAFCGDSYYIDLDTDDGVFDPDVLAKLQPDGVRARQQDGSSQELRTRQYWEDYRRLKKVWDIWLPDEGLLLTLPGDFEHLPLRAVEWNGPQAGPYERQYFGMIPGNSLPVPPCAAWTDLNDSINRLYNKCVQQAERQKMNDVVQSGAPEDAATLKNAKDGDFLTLTNVGQKVTLRSGGPDNVNLAFTLNAKDQFNMMAGNIFTMGGLQVGSGTVGQDQLLSEGANQRLRNMQVRVRALLRRVVKQMAEYLWQSPLVDIPISKPLPGGHSVNATWNRDMMPGEFPDYLVDIDPYSLGDRTPQERLMQLQSAWREDIMPALPIMQAMGQVPNFEGYIKQVAKLADLPEIMDLISFAQGEMMPGQEQIQKPTTTTRKYERTSSSPGKSQRGMEQQLVEKLLNSGFQGEGA